jgi:hypothetical protein
LIAAQQRKISFAGDVIRTVAEHLHNNVCGAEHGSAIGENLPAFLDVSRVRIAGLRSRVRFDHHFESGLGENGCHRGNERDATLSRIAFLRNSNDHAVVLSR